MFNLKRILVDLAIIASLIFLPWWVGCLIAIIAVWIFDFYEIILVGAFIDTVYFSRGYFHVGGEYYMFPFTLIAAGLLIILRFIKKSVR